MTFSLDEIPVENAIGNAAVESSAVENIAGANAAVENSAGANATAKNIVDRVDVERTEADTSKAEDTINKQPQAAGPVATKREVGPAHSAADEHPTLVENTKAEVDRAREIVEKKPVILEKLGRARGVVDVILKSAEFVGEVSLMFVCDALYGAQAGLDQLHPAANAAVKALGLLSDVTNRSPISTLLSN